MIIVGKFESARARWNQFWRRKIPAVPVILKKLQASVAALDEATKLGGFSDGKAMEAVLRKRGLIQ